MQIVSLVTVVSLAIAGVSASPSRPRPSPHSSPLVQNIECSSGAPYCCSPSKNKGHTCSSMEGSQVGCNSIAVCCNSNSDDNENDDGTQGQTCSVDLGTPITFTSWEDVEIDN